MKKVARFALLLVLFCALAAIPAVVDYAVEESRWQTIKQFPETLDRLAESTIKLAESWRTIANPQELARIRKSETELQRMRTMLENQLGDVERMPEAADVLTDKKLPYFMAYYLRSNVGNYLSLGFLVAMLIGLVVLFRLKRGIHVKIASARGIWEVAQNKERKEAEGREWELMRKIAALEGAVKNLTPLQVDPPLSPPGRRSRASPSQQEGLPSDLVVTKEAESKPWRFFLVTNDTEEGMELPNKRERFVGVLNARLKKELVALDSRMLYRKLRWVCNLSPTDRAVKMDKIKRGTIFQGWYKMRLGSFRILIKFDDDRAQVRFFPATHDIYQRIYHS